MAKEGVFPWSPLGHGLVAQTYNFMFERFPSAGRRWPMNRGPAQNGRLRQKKIIVPCHSPLALGPSTPQCGPTAPVRSQSPSHTTPSSPFPAQMRAPRPRHGCRRALEPSDRLFTASTPQRGADERVETLDARGSASRGAVGTLGCPTGHRPGLCVHCPPIS